MKSFRLNEGAKLKKIVKRKKQGAHNSIIITRCTAHVENQVRRLGVENMRADNRGKILRKHKVFGETRELGAS